MNDTDYDIIDSDDTDYYEYEGLDTYEDYEPSPYDGTYSEE